MSDDDWDADDFEPPPPKSLLDDVKDQWDDEDKEEEVKPSTTAQNTEQAKSTTTAKPKTEKKDKKKKEDIKAQPAPQEPLADPVAEKLRQQRLIEESDLKNAKELFGNDSKTQRTLEGFIPKTEAEFIEYAELLASQIALHNKSFHYLTSLKAFLRKATASLNAADTKEVSASVTVIANEKLKAEKEATAGKKKAGKKKQQLLVGREEDEDFRMATTAYDADEYDFM